MSRAYGRGFARVQANITPLIDVTFLIVIFFAIVSNLVGVDSVPMELPKPKPSAAVRPRDEPRAVVNVLPAADGTVSVFRMGSHEYTPTPDGMALLGESLADILRHAPTTEINLRADRAVKWRTLAPIVESLSRAAAVATPGRAVRVKLVVADEGAHEG